MVFTHLSFTSQSALDLQLAQTLGMHEHGVDTQQITLAVEEPVTQLLPGAQVPAVHISPESPGLL